LLNIEGFNIADFSIWNSVCGYSHFVILGYSSLTGTFGGALVNSAQNRSYPFTYTISAANTWEQKSVTIAGDTTGTWTTDNSAGLGIFWTWLWCNIYRNCWLHGRQETFYQPQAQHQ
jgi:hypothetical protein